jgi:hypothetical protein
MAIWVAPAAAPQSPFFNLTTQSDNLTASSVQTQAGGLLLGSAINRVTTVTVAADALLLPPSVAGAFMIVINAAAANSMGVFPSVGDAVNALAANAVFAIAANKTVIFYCVTAGRWHTILTA